MKICYFDAFAGISGDMTVGSLVDARADAGQLVAALESLGTGAQFTIEKTKRRGIAATKFNVLGTDAKKHRHLPHIVQMIDSAALSEQGLGPTQSWSSKSSARASRRCMARRLRRCISTKWGRWIRLPIWWARASRSICSAWKPLSARRSTSAAER